MALTIHSLGGCNCSGFACAPCSLPATDLTMSFQNEFGAFPAITLVRSGTLWVGCIPNIVWTNPAVVTHSHKFSLVCTPGVCTLYQIEFFTSTNCSGGPIATVYYDDPGGCSANPGILITLSSFSCSPLNIVLSTGVGAQQWTITP